MIKTECSKQDCFFRLEDMCCNLCAPGNDSCSLYWVAEPDKQDGTPKARRHRHTADGKLASAL